LLQIVSSPAQAGDPGTGWVHDTATVADSTDGITVSAADTRGGWLLGAGIEYGFTPNWSARVEWDHLGLADVTRPRIRVRWIGPPHPDSPRERGEGAERPGDPLNLAPMGATLVVALMVAGFAHCVPSCKTRHAGTLADLRRVLIVCGNRATTRVAPTALPRYGRPHWR
jgi:hypothetical protein